MNCKPGDLAYIIAPPYSQRLDGKFVTVMAGGACDLGTHSIPGDEFGPSWVCRFHTPWIADHAGGALIRQCWLFDSWLRPIRDQPGEDETLTWAGKPIEVVA